MKKSLDDNITDALITSDEWDNIHYDLKHELAALLDRKTFEECRDQNFAHTYLAHAEKLIREKGDIDITPLIRELRDALKDYKCWRVFMQMLRLTTIISRSGVIPEMAHTGEKYKHVQSAKGSKQRARNGLTPEKRAERNQKILEHYKKASKNGHIKLNGFATQHADKYGLRPTQFKEIIKSSLDA